MEIFKKTIHIPALKKGGRKLQELEEVFHNTFVLRFSKLSNIALQLKIVNSHVYIMPVGTKAYDQV